jgi:hypothetical protein
MRKIGVLLVSAFLASLLSCSLFTGHDNGQDTDQAALKILHKTLSIQVDETVDIPVVALKADGSQDTISVACPGGCVQSAADTSSISVHGLALGERTVCVSSGAGCTANVTVRVYDPKALMTSGLAVTYTDQFQWRWDDSGSGYDQDGGFFHPLPPSGYYALGSIGQTHYGSPNGLRAAIVVKEVDGSGALAAPTDYTQIWNDSGSGATDDGSFWLPVAPEGYQALGVVAQSGYGKPSLDDVRCVRSDLVAPAKTGSAIWVYERNLCSPGICMQTVFGSWNIVVPDTPNTPGKAYLDAGTFVALGGSGSGTPPSANPALYVLNLKLPVVTDMNDSAFVPELASYDDPPSSTDTHLSKVVAVPFSLVNDTGHDLHWKVGNSPVYRIRREDYFNKQYFYDNSAGSTPITHTVTNTVGISETESETYRVTVGLKISSSSGCDLIGGSVEVELSIEFGYETTSSLTVFQERSVSQEVIIAPHTAGCLWQKATQFALMRNNGGWEDVAGGAVQIDVDSFVKGEHP